MLVNRLESDCPLSALEFSKSLGKPIAKEFVMRGMENRGTAIQIGSISITWFFSQVNQIFIIRNGTRKGG